LYYVHVFLPVVKLPGSEPPFMEKGAPLLKRTFEEINRNRGGILLADYNTYPEKEEK
jgi:hypothetical protein